MNVSSSSVSGPSYAQLMQGRADAQAAAVARKTEVAKDAAKALSGARFKASETVKTQAREKLQALRERINILKKLYSGDPKAMAKALAQVFKELRAAVKAYKDAGGDELGGSGDAVSGAMAAAPSSTDDKPKDAQGDAQPAQDAAPAQASSGPSIYDAAVAAVRKSVGEDGLEFVKAVREMSNAISDLLEGARGQAKARKPDKDTDKAFEDADKELHGLRDDMAAMERDIRQAVPDAGMKVSVAA